MADETNPLVASYPLPPSYALEEPPTEPPPIPEKDYIVLGALLHQNYREELGQIEKSLLKVFKSGPDFVHAKELKRLNLSLLFNFLLLIETLISNPTQFEQKLDHIFHIVSNMHHLINMYRPHQSREQLLAMMETQVQNRKKLLQKMDQNLSHARRLIDMTLKSQKLVTQDGSSQ
mmetsp:Transcript_5183/g.5642  ORF Transcript_5183/g.5642 Transcript_5183/m.5642 type:complete len:175 (+) Transcript_5183:145-669(+)